MTYGTLEHFGSLNEVNLSRGKFYMGVMRVSLDEVVEGVRCYRRDLSPQLHMWAVTQIVIRLTDERALMSHRLLCAKGMAPFVKQRETYMDTQDREINLLSADDELDAVTGGCTILYGEVPCPVGHLTYVVHTNEKGRESVSVSYHL